MLAQEVPIEMKPVNPPDFFHQNSQEPKQLFWVHAKGYIGKTHILTPACFPRVALSCPALGQLPGEGRASWRKQKPPFGSRRFLWREEALWGVVVLLPHLLQKGCPFEPLSCLLLVGQLGDSYWQERTTWEGQRHPFRHRLYEWGSEYKCWLWGWA